MSAALIPNSNLPSADENAPSCPVEVTLAIIGGKWKVLILFYLLDSTQRFNELQRLLHGITHRTLARQLKELERDGIVHREAYAEIPPRVEYSLTVQGRSLEPVLRQMHDWGNKFEATSPETRFPE
ncbi:MAG: helix-turn-helix transcriptional regulator [Thermoanaerobaculia bacterium]|nr:helix-turn-helix transcriptional regulator [Thermoanaerobaculia bacterium]